MEPARKAWVYLIRNLVTGKAYIGVTTMVSLDKYLAYQLRVSKNGSVNKPKLYNSMRSHPFAWIIEPFCHCQTQPEAYRIERMLIGLFDMKSKGYNIATGGIGGKLGMKHSESTKAKMSAASRGRIWTKEQREEVGNRFRGGKNPHCGHPHTEDAKKKIGDAARGKVYAIRAATSEATKNKLRAAAAAYWQRRKTNASGN